MTVGISPHYINLTRRFIQNVGPKSLDKLSKDSGLSRAQLGAFEKTGELDPLDVMKLWGMIFGSYTFIGAQIAMDNQDFEPLKESVSNS